MKIILYLCNMKCNVALKAIKVLVLVAVLLPEIVYAQEKTIEVQSQKDSYSIIRETSSGLWLVSSYYLGLTTFSLIDETQPATMQLQLGYISGVDSMRVNDFEIFRDTVYFCGLVWKEKKINAIWGYFPLNGFPNVNVSYAISGPSEFTNLEVFSVDTTTIDLHVVMTGKDIVHQGSSQYWEYIYDEVRTASGVFNQYSSAIFNTFYLGKFYDIAVTDNNVVIASSHPDATILFVIKPTSIVTTFFSNYTKGYYLTIDDVSDIKLEYCKNDALVAVYRNMVQENMIYQCTGLRIFSFIGTTPHAHLEILGSETQTPLDVKFDKNSEDLDILTTKKVMYIRVPDTCEIYHLNPSLAFSGGPIFTHLYIDEKLNSLDWLSTHRNRFVASGHNANQNNLRVYTYQFDEWKNCTEQRIKEAGILEHKTDYVCPGIDYSMREVVMKDLYSYDMEKPLKIKCD